jgi:hypothetical protein
MTLCVGQPAALGCCRTLIIVCGFYPVVKCFCAAPMSKKNPPFGGFFTTTCSILRIYFKIISPQALTFYSLKSGSTATFRTGTEFNKVFKAGESAFSLLIF